MLSRDLIALKQWFDEIRRGERPFTAEGAQLYSECLDAAARAAAALEAVAALPAHETDPDLFDGLEAPNVIVLHRRSRPAFGGET